VRRRPRLALRREEAKDDTAKAVLGNIAAMEQVVAIASKGHPLRLKDLLKVHKTLMDLAPNPFGSGALRKKQNWIGKSPYSPDRTDHVPPPPEHVPDLVGSAPGTLGPTRARRRSSRTCRPGRS